MRTNDWRPRLLTPSGLSLIVGLLLTVHCSTLTVFGQTALDPEEPIRIATDLVDVNVSILCRDPLRPPGSLTQKDFAVFENGAAQEIAFFASTERPFDLVLLLDL